MASNDVDRLFVSLKGQVMRIPSLKPILDRWPTAVNALHDALGKSLEQRLVEWIPNPKTREKIRRINLPLFASLWWPCASLERLETVTFYTLWLFLWDDDLDGADNSLAELLEQTSADELRAQVLAYLQHHIGLGDDYTNDNSDGDSDNSLAKDDQTPEPAPPTPYTLVVKGPAEELRAACTDLQVRRFWDEIVFYMNACAVEQAHAESRSLPLVGEYWRQRLGTSSMYTYTAITEYMTETTIPDELFEAQEMKTLWFEVNRNIVYLNDMLSLKKELNTKQNVSPSLYSLIPITMKQTGCTLDGAIATLVTELGVSADAFDRAAGKLFVRVKGAYRPGVYAEVHKYVTGLRTMMTGNLYWSLACGRYNVGKYLQEDGSLSIPL